MPMAEKWARVAALGLGAAAPSTGQGALGIEIPLTDAGSGIGDWGGIGDWSGLFCAWSGSSKFQFPQRLRAAISQYECDHVYAGLAVIPTSAPPQH